MLRAVQIADLHARKVGTELRFQVLCIVCRNVRHHLVALIVLTFALGADDQIPAGQALESSDERLLRH